MIYALIDSNEVIEFRDRDDISKDERKKDWRKVQDNSENIDTSKFHVSSDFELKVYKTKVVKKHQITALNKKVRRIIERL